MAKDPELTVGDRVHRGTQTGTVAMSHVPVRPPQYPEVTPLQYLCRVRWDGNTFSTVEDSRGLRTGEEG